VSPGVRRAAEILRAGGLVAFPTETVYGLGADASNADAVARLYRVKGRPMDHPVIVHFDSVERALAWARDVPPEARVLAERFWPGPLTLILQGNEKARPFVTGGQPSVGIRVPSHPIAQQLLHAFGGGVAAPSANRFGRISPTTAAHVREDLGGDVDLVLEGGPSEVGIESTIVDLSGNGFSILRPGGISVQEIEALLKSKTRAPSAALRHSGGLARHYAPRTPARLVPTHQLDQEIARLGDKVAVLAFSRPDERVDYWIRMSRDPGTFARKLYAALRELDGAGCEQILIEAPADAPEWAAVRDRLIRACTREE
jgi:L-threonylcarbamoyladenylate synthase